MARMTYFVVLPIIRGPRGFLIAAEPIQVPSAGHAVAMALRFAEQGGAIAFSRSCDPDLGEFDEAVVLAREGLIPKEIEEQIASAA